MKFQSYQLEQQRLIDGEEVWRGCDEKTGQSVRFRRFGAQSGGEIENFEHVRSAVELDHVGIAPVLDAGEVSQHQLNVSEGKLPFEVGDFYVVSQVEDTEQMLEESLEDLDWTEFSRLLVDGLQALEHGHARGIYHTGIEPFRLGLVKKENGRRRLRIHDFGLLDWKGQCDEERVGYRAPELVAGRIDEVGPWTDLYSLGVLTCRWLYGRVIDLQEEMPPPKRGDVPGELLDWIERCITADPAERFEFVVDAQSTLESIWAGGSGGQRRSVSMPVDWRTSEEKSEPDRSWWWRYPALYSFRTPPMTGRVGARDELWKALYAVEHQEEPRGVVVEGTGGLGVGRLITWLERRARELGVADVLRATHSQIPGPTDGLASMFGRYFGCSNTGVEQCRQAIVRHFRVRGMDYDAQHLDRWARWMAVETEDDADYIDGQLQMQRMLDRISRRRPIILRVGNAHWASETLDWCAAMLDENPSLDVFFVFEVRHGELADRPVERVQLDQLCERSDVQRLEIEPMEQRSMFDLIEKMAPLEQRLSYEIVQRAAGNPLFVVQLLRDWVERGVLEASKDESGRLGLVDDDHNAIPSGLAELGKRGVEYFVGQFGDQHRESALRALEVAAVLGTEVIFSEWREVCERLRIEIPNHLVHGLFANGAASELPRGKGFVFQQSSVREVLLQSCRRSERYQNIHRVCASMLADNDETQRKDGQATTTERIGIHLYEAGAYEESLQPLLKGSQQRGNHDDSRQILVLQARYRSACDQLGLKECDPRRLRGMLREAWALESCAKHDAVRDKVETIQGLIRPKDEKELLGPVLWLRAGLAFERGDLEAMSEYLEEALEHFGNHEDRQGLARTKLRFGALHREVGELDASAQAYRRAHELFDELGDPTGQAVALRGEASVLRRKGETEDAESILRQFVESETGLGDSQMSRMYNNLGEVYRSQKRWDKAAESYRKATELLKQCHPSMMSMSRLNLAMNLVEQHRFAEAQRELNDVQEVLDTGAMPRTVIYAKLVSMPCAAARGDWEQWCESASVVEDYVRDHDLWAPDMKSMFKICLQLAEKSAPPQIVEWASELYATQRDGNFSDQ